MTLDEFRRGERGPSLEMLLSLLHSYADIVRRGYDLSLAMLHARANPTDIYVSLKAMHEMSTGYLTAIISVAETLHRVPHLPHLPPAPPLDDVDDPTGFSDGRRS